MHGAIINLQDRVFGKWVVIDYFGNEYWNCLCECGQIHKVHGANLRRGLSRGCPRCRHKDSDAG